MIRNWRVMVRYRRLVIYVEPTNGPRAKRASNAAREREVERLSDVTRGGSPARSRTSRSSRRRRVNALTGSFGDIPDRHEHWIVGEAGANMMRASALSITMAIDTPLPRPRLR
jgi:hypothetical protein